MSALHRWKGLARRGAVVFALGALLAPPAADAQATGGAKRRSTCVDCAAESRRLRALEKLDSLQWIFEHERLDDGERDRLRREMSVAVRELQSAIGELRVEMGDLERARAEAWSAGQGRAVAIMGRPSGYLGVSFDGPNTEEHRRGERIIRFYAYPRIALVEPSSPADRAGIRSGDTLVAMNGIDVVEKEISLTRMLVPDEPLLLRLRRDGTATDLRVVVGRPPAYVVQRSTPSVGALAPSAPEMTARVSTRAGRAAQVAPAAPVAAAPTVASVWVYSSGVAGAKVESVTDGLGKALGVSNGVLVLRVGPGTPAHRAGLRDGDVIVRVAGSDVRTVRDLQQQLEHNDGGRGVRLVIVRDRKQRELTLRQ